jgi:hypothetical protein
VIASAERAGREGIAFHHPIGPTLYRKKATRVYRKTGVTGLAVVPLAIANKLLDLGLVDVDEVPPSRQGRVAREPTRSRKLPLYCWKFRPTPNASARYYYTVIKNFPQPPPGNSFWVEVPRFSKAYMEQELIIHNRHPTIGWSSFFDTQTFLYIEATAPLRRHPDYQGRVGRPTRSRVVAAKRTRVPAALLSLFHSIPRHLLPATMRNDPDLIDHLQDWFVVWVEEHERAKREVHQVLMGDVETEMEIEGVEEDPATEEENSSGEEDDLVSMNLDEE